MVWVGPGKVGPWGKIIRWRLLSWLNLKLSGRLLQDSVSGPANSLKFPLASARVRSYTARSF